MDRQGPDPFADAAADPELAHLTRLLTAAPTQRELAGEHDAIRAFRAARMTLPSARRRRRRALFPSLVGAKFGATIAGVALGLTGAATAAVLPTTTSAERVGHAMTAGTPTPPAAAAAPTSTSPAAPPSAPTVGPAASGPAAKGLCTAWRAHGARDLGTPGRQEAAPPFANLIAAAGGRDRVAAYCTGVLAPARTAAPRARQPGKPTDRPRVPPRVTRPGPPAGLPVGPPTALPPAAGRPVVPPTPPAAQPKRPTPPAPGSQAPTRPVPPTPSLQLPIRP